MAQPFLLGPPEFVQTFNPLLGETPESVVQDSRGNLYVSMALSGEIRKIAPDGTQSTHAVLPIGAFNLGAFTGLIGALAIRFDDTLFVSVAAEDPANRGIWKVAPDGTLALVGTLPQAAAPNGIALRFGMLYVADSTSGAIWRVPASGGVPVRWAEDPLLEFDPNGFGPGPNGLQIYAGEVYTVNSGQGNVLAIPIRPDGSAGPVRVHAQGVPGDDFAFDIFGNIYMTTDPFNTLLLIRPDGSQHTLLTVADGLDGPTACCFGRGPRGFRTLYIANAAFPFFSQTLNANIMRVRTRIPGLPRFLF